MEPAENHEDYTSLKRSLSGIASSHANNAERIKTKGWKSPTSTRRPQANTPHPKVTEIAFAALQNLPMPLLVLSSLKTILLANSAMGRLLGLHPDAALPHQDSLTDVLRGQTLSQIGIDMLQDGIPVWISWEKFLDNVAAGLDKTQHLDDTKMLPTTSRPESTPTSGSHNPVQLPAVPKSMDGHPLEPAPTAVHDTVVDVVVSCHHDGRETPRVQPGQGTRRKPKSPSRTNAQMIISIWHGSEGEEYFTLTFMTPLDKTPPVSPSIPPPQSPTSALQSSSLPPSTGSSPSGVSLTRPALLTNEALPRLRPQAFTYFQKLTRMKDAMLSNMDIPVVGIWRDESAVFPNQAARRLFAVPADAASEQRYDFMSRFRAYTADFERELEEAENPMLNLCRTQKAFSNWKIGLVDPKSGKQRNFDVDGKPVVDDGTGEFLVGLVAFKDVTEYTEKLATQTEENEQQFQLICDTMPQMLWTTTPDGYHDYFSQRWYDYTGMTREQSLGMGWQLPFHPDDMPATTKKWAHSLATGDEYTTEYRCRRADGAWRWMLGRALPLRDVKTSQIVKWFGTCTDIQDLKSLEESNRTSRERLLEVLKHSQMTMWQVDREANVTFFEGGTAATNTLTQSAIEEVKSQIIGRSLYDGLGSYTRDSDVLKASVERVLRGESAVEIIELKTADNSRWFRSRLVAQKGKSGTASPVRDETIDGVVGISMEVTELKKKEEENVKLLAAEAAAKEANKMKSNFLANMSHEIRTPIAGIIGMSEFIMDTSLTEEQTDFAQNIQRSANTLLTVINDILDFSKIESGRLDIEEVQFSLGVVLRDVAKMLSFAAERKKLQFQSDIKLGEDGDVILLGDPGRVRQILTNLLTNSIKFTPEGGYVRLSVYIVSQASDTVLVEFIVGDTGIGIPDDVKARLFKPFSQADSSTARRFGGTGLGLSICKNLIDQMVARFFKIPPSHSGTSGHLPEERHANFTVHPVMRGKIRLESQPGSGTVATFSIPFNKPQFPGTSTPLIDLGVVPDRLQSELSLSCDNSSHGGNFATGTSSPFHSPKHKPMPNADADKPRFGAVSSPGHILIVEDNTINQQIALRTVRNLGYTASAVWNGQEALQYLLKAAANTTSPDAHNQTGASLVPSLILMDVQMPILDGYRATHILRHHAPFTSMTISSIPVVAMTASAIHGDREKCERAGMNDYLAKPVRRTTLEKMIRKWMTGEKGLASKSTTVRLEDRDAARPDLCRSGTTSTDQSSNCPGADYQVAEIQNDRNTPASRRVSIAQSPLNSFGMSQVENTSDKDLRLAEAAEVAASLRDAKLILTATGTDKHDTISSTSALGSTAHPALTGSHIYEAYREQDGPSLDLTEENIEKFNADLAEDSDPALQSVLPPRGRPQDLIPGASAVRTGSMDPIPTSATNSRRPSVRTRTESPATSPGVSRRGQLSASDRKRSDWSSASTTKPSNA